MNKVLLIIDMQGCFGAANDQQIQATILTEIRTAIKNKDHIIFVEYYSFGATLSNLMEAAKNYSKYQVVRKYKDNGAWEVVRRLQIQKLTPNHFRVCGVNTNACVLETVTGLRFFLPQVPITVVEKGCGDEIKSCHSFGLKELQTLDNLQVEL